MTTQKIYMPSAIGFLFALLFNCSIAQEESSLSVNEGFSLQSPLLKPGKVDFLYRHNNNTNIYNSFLLSPVFKGAKPLS